MANPIEVNYQVGRSLYAFRVALATGKFFNTDTNLYETFDAANWLDYYIEIPEIGATGYYRVMPPEDSLSTPATEIIYEIKDTGVGAVIGDAPAIAQGNSQGVTVQSIGGVSTTTGSDVSADIDICNLALNHLGQASIEAFDDENERARRCSLLFNNVRDMVMRDANWNFTTVIAELERHEDEDVSVTGWGYVYQCPTDLLYVRKIYGDDSSLFEIPSTSDSSFVLPVSNPTPQEFRIVYLPDTDERVIVTNLEQAFIEYTSRMGNTSLYDPMFVKAMSYKLAEELAPVLNGDDGKATKMAQNYLIAISEAKRVNGNETGVKTRRTSSFIDAR